MRLQVELLFALRIAGLGIAFVAFGRALIWIPFLVLNGKTLLCLFLGVLPIPILSSKDRIKYLSAVFTIAGSVGLVQILVHNISCFVPAGECSASHLAVLQVAGAISCYILFLVGGLRWLRRVTTVSHEK